MQVGDPIRFRSSCSGFRGLGFILQRVGLIANSSRFHGVAYGVGICKSGHRKTQASSVGHGKRGQDRARQCGGKSWEISDFESADCSVQHLEPDNSGGII